MYICVCVCVCVRWKSMWRRDKVGKEAWFVEGIRLSTLNRAFVRWNRRFSLARHVVASGSKDFLDSDPSFCVSFLRYLLAKEPSAPLFTRISSPRTFFIFISACMRERRCVTRTPPTRLFLFLRTIERGALSSYGFGRDFKKKKKCKLIKTHDKDTGLTSVIN